MTSDAAPKAQPVAAAAAVLKDGGATWRECEPVPSRSCGIAWRAEREAGDGGRGRSGRETTWSRQPARQLRMRRQGMIKEPRRRILLQRQKETERETVRGREGGRERQGEREGMREDTVCVRVRQREREKMRERARERERERIIPRARETEGAREKDRERTRKRENRRVPPRVALTLTEGSC